MQEQQRAISPPASSLPPAAPPPPTADAQSVSPLPPPAAPSQISSTTHEDNGDELTQIVGVGSAVNRVLNEMGFTRYDHIADLSEGDAERINGRIGFPGRVQRELWVEQASDLRAGMPAWTRDQQEERIRNLASEEEAPIEEHPAPSDDPEMEAEVEPQHSEDVGPDRASDETEKPDETPDDLTKIKGIGKKLAKLLNEQDIYQFAELAALSDDDVAELDKKLSFPGRIDREKWREQARDLLQG